MLVDFINYWFALLFAAMLYILLRNLKFPFTVYEAATVSVAYFFLQWAGSTFIARLIQVIFNLQGL